MSEETNVQQDNMEGCNPSECASCASAGSCSSRMKPEDLIEPQNKMSNVKHVIGVVSGKGGVGKSFVTGTLAVQLAKTGYKVGIMDADITGPSIQKMFGVKGEVSGNEHGIFPGATKNGIKIISINMLLDREDTPVLWRGPVLAGVVKQFWSDVVWGELDYLLVDMPPGTGDVPMTVFQSLPLDGVIVVTSPQDLVTMIVKKAYHMAGTMKVKVLGLIENYSYLECPDCGKRINVFGESNIEEVAEEIGSAVLGKMPLVPELARLSDEGRFEEIDIDIFAYAVERITSLKSRPVK
ncbi:MAG: P-loop NTPase [Lachnospiraceae bacterium]|jgi:Mrp family chromosome partitioning ATPase